MSELFLKIVNMSISASYLVAAVLLLRLVLKKAPKWVSVLLWGMVAIRLICPISIESVLSLIPSTQTVSPEIMMDRTPEVSTGIPAVDTVVNPVITETFAPEPIASANPLQILIPVSANLWLLGVLVMLGYTAVSYLMLRRKLATAVRLKNNIYQCENVDSPFVLGMVRPRIYLPFRMDGKNLNHVIAHEEAHIRRKDHWWKPMGFVLLAIHWFNPLMWVGYILLCRDIELACDEKVIREMNNETKADYMEALVACSVNRRRIAACPLAFGEVGVKERVKTMMNYKKPAFWIVIAAIALCIVVAVSFLTDPLKANKDFDVKLLEYPGLKWGMSPDEVIEALQLTEEQIQSQTYSGGDSATDSCYLTVKDITFFDEKVTKAAFIFRRAIKGTGDYRLYEVNLLLDENLDMNEMNRTLTKIYGEGTGKTYTTYSIDGRGKLQEYQAGGDPILAYMYNNLSDGPGKDAQHLREIVLSIVEDPEFMVENWASSKKGTKVLPKDGQKLIANYFVDRGITDRETVEQWLEKATLVAITTQNRSLSAALDASRNSEASESNVTHNQVIYSADMLIYFLETIERLNAETAQ